MRSRVSVNNVFGLLTFVALISIFAACAGTRAAYDTAQTLDAKAYVVSEHYAAILKEANDLADQPGVSADFVQRMKAADNVARPLVLQLRTAAQAYTAVRSAETEAALQEALNKAVIEVSNFLSVIRRR